MRLAMITLVFCCCSVLPMNSLAANDEKTLHNIGPQAIWQPSSEAMQKIREDCSAAAGAALGECFVRGMEGTGASAEAVAFTRLTGASAFLKGFMETGRVSVAQVEYPFRANENEGILLVNGFPRMIDVDDLSLLPKSEFQKDPLYVQLARDFPQVSLWPGDRHDLAQVITEAIPGGGQRFILDYRLRNGCHACEEIGNARFAFEFDGLGNFTGIQLKSVENRTGPDSDGNKGPTKGKVEQMEVKLDQEFTITLKSNPTTGYSWKIETAPDEGVVRLVGSVFVGPQTRLVGAGGSEIWTFKAVGRGRTTVRLKYIRPWEQDIPPVEIAEYEILVQ